MHGKRIARIAYTLVLVALMSGYAYIGLTRGFSYVLSLAFVAVMVIFARAASRVGMIRFPTGARIPFVTIRPRILSFVKGLLSISAAGGWVLIVGPIVNHAAMSDTWLGAGIIFLPVVILSVSAGLYFVDGIGFKRG